MFCSRLQRSGLSLIGGVVLVVVLLHPAGRQGRDSCLGVLPVGCRRARAKAKFTAVSTDESSLSGHPDEAGRSEGRKKLIKSSPLAN